MSIHYVYIETFYAGRTLGESYATSSRGPSLNYNCWCAFFDYLPISLLVAHMAYYNSFRIPLASS